MLDTQDTVEELEESLQKALYNIEKIAARVCEKELDAYEGFMETEKYKDEIIAIGYKLKDKGIDITQRIGDTLE
jgi:hypothetical protein